MGGNYRLPLQNFNGPYIKAEPEIQIHDITVDDAYLVLATDGLWDYLKTSHIELLLDYYKPKVNHLKEIADYLFNWVMQLASKKSGVPLEDLMRMPGGPNKRAIHDDITIIVFSFKNKK